MSDPQRISVFLCHASKDKAKVKELYDQLVADGVDAWLDQEKLLPGQKWNLEIRRAIESAHVVIVCLSKYSTTKEGYVQKEINIALDIAEEKLDDSIFIIPALLEECAVPARLHNYQWVELYTEGGYEKIKKSLMYRANQVDAAIQPSGKKKTPCKDPHSRTKENTIHTANSPLDTSEIKHTTVLPSGTNLFYVNQKSVYSAMDERFKSFLKNSDPTIPGIIEIKQIAVPRVYSMRYWEGFFEQFLSISPKFHFSFKFLLVDSDPMRELKFKGFSNWAHNNQIHYEDFQRLPNNTWADRLTISVKSTKSLPEKTGILINKDYLFFSEVEIDKKDEGMELKVGNNIYYYFSAQDIKGAKQIELFNNRFDFYWENATEQ